MLRAMTVYDRLEEEGVVREKQTAGRRAIGSESEGKTERTIRWSQLWIGVHGVIVASRNLVSAFFLNKRTRLLALILVGAEIRKAHKGFDELKR